MMNRQLIVIVSFRVKSRERNRCVGGNDVIEKKNPAKSADIVYDERKQNKADQHHYSLRQNKTRSSILFKTRDCQMSISHLVYHFKKIFLLTIYNVSLLSWYLNWPTPWYQKTTTNIYQYFFIRKSLPQLYNRTNIHPYVYRSQFQEKCSSSH